MEMEVPTVSGPGWCSLLTGASHAEHGIVDNTLEGGRHAELPDLLSQAWNRDRSRTTFAAGGWPPLIDPNGIGPIVHGRPAAQESGHHRVVASPGDLIGHQQADEEVGKAALAALADGPDASFVYFGQADEAAHAFGGLSDEYRQSIARIDDHVGRLLAVIATRVDDHGEDWSVVVTTDHGHRDEGGHGGGTDIERASFALAAHYGPDAAGTGPAQWPRTMAPTELTPRLLAMLER
jgi:predicted AlkP superfamily pyrophosphatase or phosphodiesterase